jgi:O-antigen/teichoic acid export membrane protein
VQPTINAFLLSQAAVAVIQLICSAALTWRILADPAHRAAFDLGWLREIAPFTIGMSGVAAAGVVLTQLDKVVLSHSLDLGEFGIYSLAGVFGVGIGIIANAMFLVTFPRYTELVARGHQVPLLSLYRSAAQLGSALSVAAAAVLAAFSVDILTAWTGDPGLASAAAPILGLLAAGSAFNAMWKNAYALQLAHGQTALALRLSWVVAALAVPSLVLATRGFGAVGAAAIWLVVNGALVVVGVPLTQRRLMAERRWAWLTDLAAPGAAAAIVVVAVRLLMPANSQPPAMLAAAAGASVLSVTAGLAAGPLARHWVAAQLRALRVGRVAQQS